MNSSDLMSMVDIPQPDARPNRADRLRARAESAEHDEQRASDRKLIKRLLNRDATAWREFLDRFGRLIYGRVLGVFEELGRDVQSENVEDCCAEVLAELFRGDLKALRSYKGRAKLSTWLAVVARRVTLRILVQRDRARQVQPDSRHDLSLVPAPKGRTSLSGELDCREIVLQHCLKKLSEPDRRVLALHFDDGLTYAQIGERLGVSENAVGPKLHRAQMRLRKLVRQHRPDDDGSLGRPKGGRDS